MELKKLMEHISIIPDYRQAWKVEHKLSDILLLTICAVISGAEGWEDIEDFGETHLDFLKQYGDFDNGIPVHDTIARVGNLHTRAGTQTEYLVVTIVIAGSTDAHPSEDEECQIKTEPHRLCSASRCPLRFYTNHQLSELRCRLRAAWQPAPR